MGTNCETYLISQQAWKYFQLIFRASFRSSTGKLYANWHLIIQINSKCLTEAQNGFSFSSHMTYEFKLE